MKKEIFIHFSFLFSFLLFISIVRGWISLSYWPLWLGCVIGNFLPDLDHFIYVYFLKPQEFTSQRVGHMVGKKDYLRSINLLAETRSERTKLIFHTLAFQLIFLVLTFLVMTSSGSLLGRGVVLAFFLHLLVDQAMDLTQSGNLNNWTGSFPISIGENQSKAYWFIMFLALLVFGFLL